MKRVILHEAALASSQRLDSDVELSPQKQDLTVGNRRARTSAAMLGLALSMGASAVVMPRDGDSAAAAEVKPNEPIVTTLPESRAIALEDFAEPVAATPTQRHVVREGQTLWEIAELYGVGVDALETGNGVTDETVLQVGQTLKVAGSPDVAIAQPVALTARAFSPIPLARPQGITEQDLSTARMGMGGSLAKMAEQDLQLRQDQEKSLAVLRTRAQTLKDELTQARLLAGETAESDKATLGRLTVASSPDSTAKPTATLDAEVATAMAPDISPNPAADLTAVPAAPAIASDEMVAIAVDQPTSATPATTANVDTVDVAAELTTIEQTTAGLTYSSEVQVAVSPRIDQAAPLTSVTPDPSPRLPSVLPELQPREPVAEPIITAHTSVELESTQVNADPESATVALRNIDLPVVPTTEAAPAPATAYRIQAGDTLHAIARRHGVPVQTLAALNGIQNPNRIFVGAALTIPGQAPEPVATESLTDVRPAISVAARSVGVGVIQPQSLATENTSNLPVRLELGTQVTDPFPGGVTRSARLNASPSVNIDDSVQSFEESLTARAGQLTDGALAASSVQSSAIGGQDDGANSTATPELSIYAQQLLVEMREMRLQRAAANQNTETASDPITVVETVETATTPVAVAEEPIQVAAIARPSLDDTLPETRLEPEPALAAPTPARPMAEPQLIAAAPIGAENYAPINRPEAGQIVSPDLPPLPGSEEFLPGDPTSNGFVWPARGVLTSGYGWRWGRMHQGIDVAAPIGTPVVSSAAGVVISSGWNSGGYGNLVEVRHADGTLTRYAHNNRLLVRPGQRVNQGQQIAEMGSTGYSTGPHVHFEVHPPNQGAANPMAYLPGR